MTLTPNPKSLRPGSVTFVDTGFDYTRHNDLVTQAWAQDPLTWLFSRIPGYPKGKPIATKGTRNSK